MDATETLQKQRLLTKIRAVLVLFIAGLVLSGITAFPLLRELELLGSLVSSDAANRSAGGLAWWILHVRDGLRWTYTAYPFLAYGTDWLAFGHLVIALFFVPSLLDPRRNVATLYVGIAACAGVLPLALICGPLRGIPFYWRLIDCSFGLLGVLPLWLALRWTRQLGAYTDER